MRMAAILAAVIATLYTAGWSLLGPVSDFFPSVGFISWLGGRLLVLACVLTAVCLIRWALVHRLKWGFRHAFTHAWVLYQVRAALLAVGGTYGNTAPPRVKLNLSRDLSYGTLMIRNHIKYDKQLESVNLSSALGRYITENQYRSDDENWHVYEIEDGRVDRQLIFESYQEFVEYCRQYEDYTLFMDKQTAVPLSSMLLVGLTGSGKTYALYSLILQLQNWRTKPELYFVDPKGSSLCVLGSEIETNRAEDSIEGIISLLEQFYSRMQERKAELKERLKEKLDADYRHWHMPAHIFFFDELGVFQSVANTLDKKTRDNFNMWLRSIVLQGRQLGFFLWAVMQKSDSTDIPTAIRDNLVWKVVLGQATNTTYMTTFEHAADLPKRKFGLGQGLYSYQGRTRQPKITSFPTLDFDILEAAKETGEGPPVMTGGPRKEESR